MTEKKKTESAEKFIRADERAKRIGRLAAERAFEEIITTIDLADEDKAVLIPLAFDSLLIELMAEIYSLAGHLGVDGDVWIETARKSAHEQYEKKEAALLEYFGKVY